MAEGAVRRFRGGAIIYQSVVVTCEDDDGGFAGSG